MVLAWKKAQRFAASTFLAIDSVCAPLPSVSDSARHSAITAISNAIFLFSPEACSACSACSMLSCALMIPLQAQWQPTIAEQMWPRQGRDGCDSCVSGRSASRMRAAIDFQQPLTVDAGIDLLG